MNRRTSQLEPGDYVATTDVVDTDFGIPLVEPTHRMKRRVNRTVKSVVGGVVRFTDGTKSRPLHGRTCWELEEIRAP